MSSSPIDIVKVFYGTFSLMGAEKAGLYLARDFKLTGFTAAEMDKATWIGFLKALKTALPDMKIRLTQVTATNGNVRVTEIGMGTHIATMDMALVGLPEIPPGGFFVTFPAAEWNFRVADGKIVDCELLSPPSPDTGLAGMQKAFFAASAPAA